MSDEEKLYLLAASQPLRDIATMMLETGMRPDEVCRIRRENVHLDQGYIFNPYGKTRAAKRKVPLSERALTVLLKRMEEVKGEYLFPGRLPGSPIVKDSDDSTLLSSNRRTSVCRNGKTAAIHGEIVRCQSQKKEGWRV